MDVTPDDSNVRHVPVWWKEFFSDFALDFVRYSRGEESTPVSYTHLTLQTILLV